MRSLPLPPGRLLGLAALILLSFTALYYLFQLQPIPFWPTLWSSQSLTSSSHASVEGRPKAAFVILARNRELYDILGSIRQLEDRFNLRKGGGYDYVFLNNEEFSKEFKERTSLLVSTSASYGLIPPENWHQPNWIDEDKSRAAREAMTAKGVLYGDSVSYRNMCRFNSGFFYRHVLLKQYNYYWRVEPGVKFYCDVDRDPFEHFIQHNISYGFTITLPEYSETIPTLWETVKEFMKLHPEYIAKNNALDFISDDGGETYNGCHFWSNFEIGNLNFWRSPAYNAFFDHLEATGNFYYERWGDAPVHSIAASLLLPKDQVLFMKPVGYYHIPFHHCPTGSEYKSRCHCDPSQNFDYEGWSCLRKWEKVAGKRHWEL